MFEPQKIVSVEMTETSCRVCGICFIIPASFNQDKRENGTLFYCPNGHSLAYYESETEKYKRLLAEETKRRESEFVARNLAEDKLRRLEKRIFRGVCPKCKRRFSNVQRHMETKHGEKA